MDNNAEYQYLVLQLNANETLRTSLNLNMTHLATLMHQQRDIIRQIDEYDQQINTRLNAIGHENKTLVKFDD